MSWFKKFVTAKEEGASIVEYGLLVGLIAVACIGAVTSLGGAIATFFNTVNAAI